jgi:hypothetical protein
MLGKKRAAFCIVAGSVLAASSCSPRPVTVEAAAEPAFVTESVALFGGNQPVEEKPVDRGSKLASEMLAPGANDRAQPAAVSSPQRKPARDLQEPAVLPPSSLSLPRPLLEKRGKVTSPVLIEEPAPLFDQLTGPHLPEQPHLAVGPRLRIPSPDVNQPIPLPQLGQPAQDKVSLDDPTLDASTAMALALSPPLRVNAAPFLRLVLPNPFENRDAIRLRKEIKEDTTPVTATPRVPGK